MRIGRIVMVLMALARSAGAADATVYIIPEGAMTTYAAKRIAWSLFRKVGVTIAWETRPGEAGGKPGIWFHVTLAARTPDDFLPGALAVAYPYSGGSKGITVFCDRIRLLASGPNREPPLLAYVLVHEITHVLQAVDRHSKEGVMKAVWSAEDRSKIFERRLAFLEEDVMLMRRGLAMGCRQKPGTLTGRSESESGFHPE